MDSLSPACKLRFVDAVVDEVPVAVSVQKVGLLQDLEVLGDGALGQSQRSGQCADTQVSSS